MGFSGVESCQNLSLVAGFHKMHFSSRYFFRVSLLSTELVLRDDVEMHCCRRWKSI